eukprot:c29402_g1_i1 orf=3-920(-)
MLFCRSCDVCQSYSIKRTTQSPLHPIPPLGPFEKWGIDFVGPLHITPRRNQFILVATDYLTKWVEARPLKSATAEETARFLYERIITRFGCPREIVSDQGPQFMSYMVSNIMERMAIKHRCTTTYKPSSNGLAERTNHILCKLLAKEADLEANRHNWDKKIHAVLWAYRVTSKTTTGFSPFKLTYGIEGILPIEYDVSTLRTLTHEHLDEEVSIPDRITQLHELEETRCLAVQAIEKAQQKQKKAFDAKVKTCVFDVGTLVQVYDSRHHARIQKKFLPTWEGPYKIVKAHYDNGTYELEELDGKYY